MTKVKDGWEIEFIPSHARHFLRQSHPDFAAMSEMLERAHRLGNPLLVTERLTENEIIDVRPVPGEAASPSRPRRSRRGYRDASTRYSATRPEPVRPVQQA